MKKQEDVQGVSLEDEGRAIRSNLPEEGRISTPIPHAKQVADGFTYPCGCVKGQYWCGKHDIYVKQDPKDPAPHGISFSQPRQPAPTDSERDEQTCTCFITAPCSYCTH